MTTRRPRADQVHDLTRRINAEPTGPTIEEELIERRQGFKPQYWFVGLDGSVKSTDELPKWQAAYADGVMFIEPLEWDASTGAFYVTDCFVAHPSPGAALVATEAAR